MQRAIDWIALWRALVTAQVEAWHQNARPDQQEDAWRERARKYDAGVKARWAKPDSSRTYVTNLLQAHPDWTALDIGGGTGAWTLLMARQARQVTVVEPSASMRTVMQENIEAEGARNVVMVPARWPEAQVEPHDLVFCAHAMYGQSDWAEFVRGLLTVARRRIVLLMRAPLLNGLMAQAATRVWGHPYDSPNFQVAYNALLQMGIFADVYMEDSGLWRPWTNASLEDAYAEVKRKLHLPEPSEHDAFLRDLLQRNLVQKGDEVVWPRETRSALVTWDVERSGENTPRE
jgi:predicted O-methyltransferase YrrM